MDRRDGDKGTLAVDGDIRVRKEKGEMVLEDGEEETVAEMVVKSVGDGETVVGSVGAGET